MFHHYKSPLGPPNETGIDEIDARFLLNLSVSYKVWKENVVYVRGKNLLNSTRREFGFADKIRPVFTFGLRANF